MSMKQKYFSTTFSNINYAFLWLKRESPSTLELTNTGIYGQDHLIHPKSWQSEAAVGTEIKEAYKLWQPQHSEVNKKC